MTEHPLIAFLRARYDEREQWATEASRCRDHVAEGGVHWRWGDGGDLEPVTPDPARGEDLTTDDGGYFVGRLVSVEEFPFWSSSETGPQIASGGVPIQDIPAAVAGHIVMNDPAYVLADIAAKRKILDMYEQQAARQHENAMEEDRTWVLEPVLALLAEPYADHPDYPKDQP